MPLEIPSAAAILAWVRRRRRSSTIARAFRGAINNLPEFTDVQREQLEQRRAYGLEILSVPDERRLREIFIAGREPLSLERK